MNFRLISLKSLIFNFLLLWIVFVSAQETYSLVSWNIRDFGRTKTQEDIEFIAAQIHDYDIIAIQEVVAGYGGAQAVARLADQLDRMGSRWDYALSQPTTGSSHERERYVFLWKAHRAKLVGNAELLTSHEDKIVREPFMIRLQLKRGPLITLVNFHALPKSKQPEREIKYFKYLPLMYPLESLIFLGDFNLPDKHTVFNPLKKMGYRPIFENQKTSLKQERDRLGNVLASPLDNIFYPSKEFELIYGGIINFTEQLWDFSKARHISDHVPIVGKFLVK